MNSKSKLSRRKSFSDSEVRVDRGLQNRSFLDKLKSAPQMSFPPLSEEPLYSELGLMKEELQGRVFFTKYCVNCTRAKTCPILQALLNVANRGAIYTDARVAQNSPLGYLPYLPSETSFSCLAFSERKAEV